MNKLKRIPYIPQNIEINKDHIFDHNLHADIPINETAYKILLLIDGIKSVSEITEHLNEEIKINYDVLYNDINNLFYELNTNYLLNWKYKTNIMMKKIFINFIAQYKKGYKERVTIKNSSFFSVFNSINNVIFKKIGMLFTWTLALYILSVVLISDSLASGVAFGFLIAFVGLILSTNIHELSHMYTLWIKKKNKNIGFLGISPLGVRFVRPAETNFKNNIIIALSGSIIPGTLGVLMYIISFTMFKEWQYSVYINIFAGMFIIQLVHLLPFTGDGKNILNYILLMIYNKKII